MKIESSHSKTLYDFVPNNRNTEERYICPECSHTRKKSKDKCFAWDNLSNRGYCHNCGSTFFEYKPLRQKKEYFIPEWKNETLLTDKAVRWFTSRMISQETLNRMKVYSSVEFMPQFGKEVEVMCFPYFRDGKLVNIKYRGPEKSFKQVKDAELIWWNYDCIASNESVIICEGEIDLLTFVENGFDNVISVPAGAGNNVEYFDNTVELFNQVKTFIIATDIDTKGIELRDELIRRIGPEKCLLVDFEGCKDANEYYCKNGGIKFKEFKVFPAPVKGIVTIDDLSQDIQNLIDYGIRPGLEIGVDEIDQFIKWELGQLAIVTGIPSSGKSEFIDFLCAKFNLIFGWKTAFFTPENYPLVWHVNKIYEKLAGKSLKKSLDSIETANVLKYINDNFFYILDEEDLSVGKILDSAKMLVKSKGVKVLVVDPYNTIDHQYDKQVSETKYISEFLTKLQQFARFNNMLVFLIAHPTKMVNGEIPNLYSISGSAHFYNKADYGIVVHRETNSDNIMTGVTTVYWKKIRFKHLGEQGISRLIYNYNNGRYEKYGSDVISWDNSNWILNDSPGQDIAAGTPF